MSGIFLDRDGVIIRKAVEGEYISDWSEVEFLPGALEAIGAFCQYERKVIIVTNQRGVAIGKTKLFNLHEIHARLKKAARKHGGEITEIYFCPHDISEECLCRKPKPGMLLRAAKAHGLQFSECWMIGDSVTDIEAGRRVGCKTALISSFPGIKDRDIKPDICERSLSLIVHRILQIAQRAKLK
jgi:D-glycero-D-manno-heptose 1,7-bisphosphate phosphatase